MLLKLVPVFFIFLLLMLGCNSTETVESTQVAPKEIYQSYSVNASPNETSVNATFRVGGSTGATVDLDLPSKVLHNGKQMNESKPFLFKGTDYNDADRGFVARHQFAYTDAEGKVWTNEISLEALEIKAQNLTVSKMKGGKLTLSRPVGTDEKIEFSIVSEKNPPAENNSNSNRQTPQKDYSAQLKVRFDETRTSLTIEPASLKNFADGKAYLKVIVRKDIPVQQSAKGGSMNFTYESNKVSVNVIN